MGILQRAEVIVPLAAAAERLGTPWIAPIHMISGAENGGLRPLCEPRDDREGERLLSADLLKKSGCRRVLLAFPFDGVGSGATSMMGQQGEDQAKLFYEFYLEDRVPAGHMLRKIDRFLDLGTLRRELAPFLQLAGPPLD